jgi:hypothetical protein
MFAAFATMFVLQPALVDTMAANQALSSCIKLTLDDALLRDIEAAAFPAHLERVCGPARDAWMKARNAADGEDADEEGTFYEAKARFDAAASEYQKRRAGR